MATIQRWDPFRELLGIHDAIGRPWRRSALPTRASSWVLPVDVREDEDANEISASLPGVAKDDIGVSVEHGVLTIQAKTAEADEAAGDGYVLRERRAGSFRRAIHLMEM
ncbi:MAG: Hsp20 family protein [Chloroflexi bacterium]|nr:Hsp20 family protein [Chloroflexota bacterium]